MSIVIAPNLPSVAAPAATPVAIVLQPGSVISAKVLQILGNDQVQISIGGQAIDVVSQVPLQAGQTLQLQVSQTANGIGLAVVNQQGGAAASQAPGIATVAPGAVTLAPSRAALAAPANRASDQSAHHASRRPRCRSRPRARRPSRRRWRRCLPISASPPALPGLPPQVQQAVAQVLAQQTSLDQNLTGSDIKQAFQASGLFLEASLAAGIACAVDRHAGSQGGADRAAPGADDVALGRHRRGHAGHAHDRGDCAAGRATCGHAASHNAGGRDGAAGHGRTGDTPTTLAQQGTTTVAALLAQAGEPSVATSPQPVTILAGPPTPRGRIAHPRATARVRNVCAHAVAPQGAAPAIAQDILDLTAANQILPPTATPADAAARAAAASCSPQLLQEALQASPLVAGNASRLVVENSQMLALMPAVTGARTPAIDDPEFARANLPPPPINGALPSAQPVMPATIVSHAPVEATLQHLLTDTDGAIARQTLLQVASLARPDRHDRGTARPHGAALEFRNPVRDAAGHRDGAIRDFARRRRPRGECRQAGLAGAVLARRRTGRSDPCAGLAERRADIGADVGGAAATAAQLRAGVSQLSQALSRAELQPGDIVVRDGAPAQPASAPAGHFLDRAL